jgi:hypothetical protein
MLRQCLANASPMLLRRQPVGRLARPAMPLLPWMMESVSSAYAERALQAETLFSEGAS